MYRKFTLTNSDGNVWTLTDQNFRVFLNDPQGLGLTDNLTVTTYGNVQRVDNELFTFPQVTGDVIFYDTSNADRYQKYNDFARFISHTPLTLSYEIPTATPEVYTLPCYVTQLQKGESKTDNLMTCPITIQGLDFWKGAEVTLTGSGTSYSITNGGDYEVGMEITITGTSMEEPYFTLTKGDIYGEAKLTDTFDSVYINSNDTEQNMELESGGATISNPLSYQDLSISNGTIYVTFLKLARGTSTLNIGMTSGTLSGVTIKFTPRYRSV